MTDGAYGFSCIAPYMRVRALMETNASDAVTVSNARISLSPGVGRDSRRPLLIFRHFGIPNLLQIDQGFDFGEYDGFVYAGMPDLASAPMVTVAALIAQGKLAFRYFSLGDYGTSSFVTSWPTWWQDTVQNRAIDDPPGWDASVYDATGNAAVFYAGYGYDPPNEGRGFVDWRAITAGARRQAVIDKMLELSPGSGLWLDHGWLAPGSDCWMYKPGWAPGGPECDKVAATWVDRLNRHAAWYSALLANNPNPGWDADHSASIRAFITDVAAALETTGRYALTNGESRTRNGQIIPRPFYYENSNSSTIHTWAEAVAGWKRNARNVLTIDVPDAAGMAALLTEWGTNGGWVGFTGNFDASDPEIMAAYAEAEAYRADL